MTDQAWLEGAKKRFDFEAWPRRVGAAAELRTRGLALFEVPSENWVFERRVAQDARVYTDYFHEAAHPEHRIMVRVSELEDHGAALAALLELLSHSMAVTLPRFGGSDGRTEEPKVGDVAFRGHSELVTVVFFVRHNVLGDVRSIGDEPVSVLPFATVVDRQILAAAS